MQLYGATAQVYLKYEGGMESLAQVLIQGLVLPDFYFDTDDEPPHSVTGHCETLGFELWLNKSARFREFPYSLEIGTMLSFEESFNDQMYDMSPWLGRFISKICEIESCVVDSETTSSCVFKKGEVEIGPRR